MEKEDNYDEIMRLVKELRPVVRSNLGHVEYHKLIQGLKRVAEHLYENYDMTPKNKS